MFYQNTFQGLLFNDVMVLLWYLFKIRICETNNILHKSLKNSYGVSYSWLLVIHQKAHYALSCLVLCCYDWKVKCLCFVCVLLLAIHPHPLSYPLSLSSLLFYHIKLFYGLHAFFILLFPAIGYTAIYTIILQQHFQIFCSVFLLKYT